MIVCGWCGHPTAPDARCANCRHEDPAKPWLQRGETAPLVEDTAGRPPLDRAEIGQRLAVARQSLTDAGRRATVEALAELLDVSPRTVRRWREMST